MPHRHLLNGRVLVVDDNQTNLRVVSTLLERHGHTVAQAESGDAALALMQSQTPDLLLLDMMMPNKDGFDVLQAMQADAKFADIPVIFLTAAQDRDLLLRAFEAGVVDYVTKPFIPEELLARVSSHLHLKLSRDRLRRLAREKQELVNLVAHDLKNPLTSVLFASDILRSDEQGRQERLPRYLEMIHDSAMDALSYIRRYLESEASGQLNQHAMRGDAPLADVIDWLIQRYSLQFEARGTQLKAQPVAAHVHAWIDPLVLRQVCENLITNALKYAPHSDVEISLRPAPAGFVQLVVEDRGPGIDRNRERELFKPFTRLSDNDPINGLSSGLGLSLARQIISDVGGGLWYEDREGGGARFVVELPLLPAQT